MKSTVKSGVIQIYIDNVTKTGLCKEKSLRFFDLQLNGAHHVFTSRLDPPLVFGNHAHLNFDDGRMIKSTIHEHLHPSPYAKRLDIKPRFPFDF